MGRFVNMLLCLSLLLPTVAFCGCGGNETARSASRNTASSQAAQGRIDNLSLAMAFVFSEERVRPEPYVGSVVASLNHWTDEVEEDDTPWEMPKLVDTLAVEFQNDLEQLKLDQVVFGNRDAEFLEEAVWCKALGKRMEDADRFSDFRWLFANTLNSLDESQRQAFRSTPDRLAYLIGLNHPDLDRGETRQLATVLRLFDWIIRNVQLDPLRDVPNEIDIEREALISANTAPGRSASSRGVPGPGYTLFPWQSIKFGHGDALQRARILILACRQINIDAVMLGVPADPSDSTDSSPTPWVPAVLIGDHLFLFDTQLGLAVPKVGGEGIATLADVQTTPEILQQLEVTLQDGSDTVEPYRISADETSEVVALIDAAPNWYSRAMQVLSSNLTGNQRLELSFDPDEQAERLAKLPVVHDVRLWNLPYHTLAYRNIFEQAVARQLERAKLSFVFQELVYDVDIRCTIGRHRAILGMIEDDQPNIFERSEKPTMESDSEELLQGSFDTPGAKSIFYSRRLTDDDIDALRSERELQLRYGIDVRGELTPDDKQAMIATVQSQLRIVRANASYWLALAHFESTTPATAINWFERVEEYDIRGTWQSGTVYNTGRAYEAIGDYAAAVKQYQSPADTQQLGNLLRARFLGRLTSTE